MNDNAAPMAPRPVYWEEGMFILPHHFQAAQRSWIHEAQLHSGLDHPYNCGLRTCVLDNNALANRRFVVKALRARLSDGTVITVPEDGLLEPLELERAFATAAVVDVFLAVPVLDLSKRNVTLDGSVASARFARYVLAVNDESTGDNPKHVEFLRLKYRLLPSTEDGAGYELLRIARVQRATQQGALQLDSTYIPPLLACDAWKVLQTGILQDISNLIGAEIEVLAKTVVARGISFDSHSQGDQQYFQPLRVLNEAYALLEVVSHADGVHPFTAYLLLCQLVGQLCILGPARRPPALPKYDHDNLGHCFYTVKKYILDYLRRLKPVDYVEIDFIGVGKRIQLVRDLEPAEMTCPFYVGLQSPTMPAEDCVHLFTDPLAPNMKIGSPNQVDGIYTVKSGGVVFTHVPKPPALPDKWVFFKIDLQKSPLDEWEHIQRERKLAIRLSEAIVPGDIDGQTELTIRKNRAATQTFPMTFKLFVVRG